MKKLILVLICMAFLTGCTLHSSITDQGFTFSVLKKSGFQ